MELKYLNYLATYKKIIGNSFDDDQKLLKSFLIAVDLFNKDNIKKAIDSLNKVLKKCSNDSQKSVVYIFLGLCYEDLKYPNLAMEAYSKSIKYDETKSTAWSNLGTIHRSNGDFEDAINSFLKAMEVDPKNAYAYQNLGALYYRMAKNEEAIKYSKLALKYKANLYQASEILFILYYIEKNNVESKKYYQMSISNGSNQKRLDGLLAEYDEIHKLCEEIEDEN